MLGELGEGDVAVEGAVEQGADRRGLEEDVRLVLGVEVAVAQRLDVQVAGQPLVEDQRPVARLGRGSRVGGAVLDQARLAALGKRDLDQVEVARRDRARERLARLGEHRADVIARGDVDEREHARRRPRRRARRPGAPVEWPVSAARSVSSSAKLESWTSSWASCAATPGHLARRGVAADHELAPGARLAHHLARGRPAPARAVDRLAVLEPLERPGPARRRAAAAASGSKRPGRSSSTSA